MFDMAGSTGCTSGADVGTVLTRDTSINPNGYYVMLTHLPLGSRQRARKSFVSTVFNSPPSSLVLRSSSSSLVLDDSSSSLVFDRLK